MDFKRVSIVKYPVEAVWLTMRDKMPEVASLLDEIKTIDLISSEADDTGKLNVTKVWSAAPSLPDFVRKHISDDMISWTEHGIWQDDTKACHWNITSHAFNEAIHCEGITQFQSALGGKGTRITFSGTINIDMKQLSHKIMVAQAIPAQVIELIAKNIIPRNFAESTKGVEAYLAKNQAE